MTIIKKEPFDDVWLKIDRSDGHIRISIGIDKEDSDFDKMWALWDMKPKYMEDGEWLTKMEREKPEFYKKNVVKYFIYERGYISAKQLDDNRIMLQTLFVKKYYRGRGYAKRLMEEMLSIIDAECLFSMMKVNALEKDDKHPYGKEIYKNIKIPLKEFNERQDKLVKFYSRYGFEIIEDYTVPDGIRVVNMKRENQCVKGTRNLTTSSLSHQKMIKRGKIKELKLNGTFIIDFSTVNDDNYYTCDKCGVDISEKEYYENEIEYQHYCDECFDQQIQEKMEKSIAPNVKVEFDDDNNIILFHEVRIYENSKIRDVIDSLEKNGLQSHSAIGRSKVDDYGNIIVLSGDRIWFSKEFGDMTSKDADILLRVKISHDILEDKMLKLDDQYFGNDNNELMLETCGEFTIHPINLELRKNGDWEHLDSSKYHPTKRTLTERLQPSIKKEFERLGIKPTDTEKINFYVQMNNSGEIDIDSIKTSKQFEAAMESCEYLADYDWDNGCE